MRLHLGYCAQFGAPQYRMDTDILEYVQWRATNMVGEQLREE